MSIGRAVGVALLSVAITGAGPATRPAAADGGGFLHQVSSHFGQWDADHDGVLSANEIEVALDDPANTGPAAAAAATLRRAIRANSKISPVTMDSLTRAVNGPADPAAPKPPAYEATFRAAVHKIATTKRDLFADGGPHVATLGQGRLGDCFLLAGVGTIAACQPDRLRHMMSVRPDGQVAVQLGGVGEPVVLPPPTDGEVVIGANAANTYNDGVWANVLEKAIGHVYLGRQKTRRHSTPYSIIGVGGTPNSPLSLMTGHACRRVGCEDFQKPGLTGADRDARLNAMRDELASAFKSGRLVVGGTGDLHGGGTVVPGLYYDHSYGVLAYDRATDTVTFWNPMGNGYTPKGEPGLAHGYPTSHGRFEVKLPEAVMWFGSFSVETDQPVAGA